MSKVTVVDYGVGNLKSVARVLEHAGADVVLTSDPELIANAERLLLPGVGAFGHCMNELASRQLIPAIHDFVGKERPFLGICVGMQIMLERGEEFGEHTGLGLISGTVRRINAARLPYIGWAQLQPRGDWTGSLLSGTAAGEHAYLLHSYQAECNDVGDVLASYRYEGETITAAIQHGHLTGLQFHPEKSGEAGIHIMRNFTGVAA